jgi:hypothetical protein
MAFSAFVSRDRTRQGTGGPAMTFNAMLVRPAMPATGGAVPKLDAFTACGLLTWNGATFEAAVSVVKGRPLARSGEYLVDASASGDALSGAGAMPAGFRIPMRLSVQPGGFNWPWPQPTHGHNDRFLQAALDAQLGVRTLALHGPVHGLPLPGIGLLGADAALFRERWRTTPRDSRPTRLHISLATAASR